MSRSSKIYAYFISIVGLALGSYSTYLYITSILAASNVQKELTQFGVLWFLYILCRCFPIYIRENYTIDMSFICNLVALLYKGPVAAATMILISVPFVVVQLNTSPKTYLHIFNVKPIKTTFNTANYILSVYSAGLAYTFFGGKVGTLELPKVILPMVAATFVCFIVNAIILLLLFSFMEKTPFFPAFFKTLIELLPNVVATAPLGYFIARCITMDGGEYIVLLFMLPLMMARYSFSLYLDVKQNYYNMVKTLTAALEAKDQYTEGHSHRVEGYAEKIARKIHLPAHSIEDIKVAALLHDIGKIGIDDTILNKPGRLTDEERAIIMTHPQIAENILKNVKLNKMTRTIILHHHERYDGKGYPGRTKEDEVPIEVYVVALADAYDAMTSNRPYCGSLSLKQVVQVLNEESGKQFHPKAVDAFLQVLHEEGKI